MNERSLAPLALALLGLAGCSYAPPRFRDAAAVRVVRDDSPIPTPARTALPAAVRHLEAYVIRAVALGLDPERIPDALDVNAFDEVPASSWFAPGREPTLDDYVKAGEPVPPFQDLPARERLRDDPERVVLDANGLRWELVPDEPHRQGMRPAAGAIASRLFHALGYYTAESHSVITGNRDEVLAIRYPAARGGLDNRWAADLGPTRSSGTRDDDANDKIDHEHRRSMRGATVALAWLGVDQVRPDLFRDVYVGDDGKGFVQHQLRSFEDALGSATLVKALHATDPDRPPRNVWVALGTLGFTPKQEPDPYATIAPSVGIYPMQIDLDDDWLSVPFAPGDQLLPGDVYWMVKRIAAIPRRVVGQAVRAGKLEDKPAAYLEQSIWSRRIQIVRHGMSLVTPIEVRRFAAEKKRPSKAAARSLILELEDQAIVHGVADAKTTRYRIEIIDDEGDRLTDARDITAKSAVTEVEVPETLLATSKYLIVTVRAEREGTFAPRAFQIHLGGTPETPKLLGVRH